MDKDNNTTEITVAKNTTFLFHPTTVIVLILLDWGGFVLEVPQVLSPLTLILTFTAIFICSSVLTFFLQKHFSEEDNRTAILKSLLAGIICAIPSGVMTTAVGSLILLLSGFEAISKQGIGGLLKMFQKD